MYIYIQLTYPILGVEHPLLISRPADLDIPLWRLFQDVARKSDQDVPWTSVSDIHGMVK